MNKNENLPQEQGNWSRSKQDAAAEDLRKGQQELQKLRTRVSQLEAALARADSTAEVIAHKTEAEGQRRNINDAVRESLITSLQAENKQLLIRVDRNVLKLATAEDRLRDLSTQLILAHENEQRRIAQEIHDELGQDLTGLKLLIGRGKAADAQATRDLLVEAGQVAETLLQSVREICSRLRPQVLDDLGLIAGLSVLLKNFGNRSGLTFEFEHGAIDEQRLTPIVQSVVFRVIQEALTNVARHAKTPRARVSIAMDGEELVFAIQDDGCGFDAEQIKNSPSTGLSGIVERILLVNGTSEIMTQVNRGTSIKCRIPLKERAARHE